MHCNYCGALISKDDVHRQQKVGFSTENETGEMMEVDVFVVSASCSCGSTTQHQMSCTNDSPVIGGMLDTLSDLYGNGSDECQ